MAVQHFCDKRPGFKKGDDPWVEGRVDSCPHHGDRSVTQIVFKSRQEKKRADASGGVIGHDSGSGFFRDGPER